ncbi:MAG: epoxyqueuosine reductase QueH [Lachnospiraceae bacterium]
MNYQAEMDRILSDLVPGTKRLFLHSCCAPCSSYVIEYLSRYFRITVFYYNPNITDEEEYWKRAAEEQRLIASMPTRYPVTYQEGRYDPEGFFGMAKGLEKCPEGQERCFGCYELRLTETAKQAKMGGYDYFATTLTISPLKKADVLNEIGMRLGAIYDIPYLCSDFKKKNGYKRSIELSREYGLYRQDYCGCIFSKVAREQEKENANAENIKSDITGCHGSF